MSTAAIQMQVASPCSVKWSSMIGNTQVRFCGLCRKDVYNLSAMDLEEVQELVRERKGQVCVRFYRRADGTVLTADCPVGANVASRRLWRRARRAGLAALGIAGAGLAALGIEGNWVAKVFGQPMMGALANQATVNVSAARSTPHRNIIDFSK
jgi:hypothetical protein